jgi:16S rRNA (guanine(966)-N(2))-methyltransferase RsmD
MRVIAGKYRHRLIKPAKTPDVRPTSDKVKGALFNMLEPWAGTHVLDLYSGTGNLGIEAVSRGASEVVFVDQEPLNIKLIRENLASLGLKEGVGPPTLKLYVQKAAQAFFYFKNEGKAFDVILADPPYEPGAAQIVQNLVREYPILAPGGILAIEHGEKDPGFASDFPHELVRHRKYGETLLSVFRRSVN